jgi:hypothetical protein
MLCLWAPLGDLTRRRGTTLDFYHDRRGGGRSHGLGLLRRVASGQNQGRRSGQEEGLFHGCCP